MSLNELYQTNENFKDYIDKYLLNNPDQTKEQIFEHKIIKEIAKYYSKEGEYRL